MAYSKGSLVLSKATVADIPALSPTFPRAFHDTPIFAAMLPDTPANDKWWQQSHEIALLDPQTHCVKVVDQETGEIVALARWLLPGNDDEPQPGSAEDRWPDFTDETDRTLTDALFGAMERGREKFMGNRKHYCKLADVTQPELNYHMDMQGHYANASSLGALTGCERVPRPWCWLPVDPIRLRPGRPGWPGDLRRREHGWLPSVPAIWVRREGRGSDAWRL